ncbi:hypothetical protein F4821DRAFT_229955 [Hypoxylon rubiginosum]|uniref:Uncharacterized protein n=1 Tax=Hypoxylon rubiginosum TaxID=110542 RepID=A0ACC0DC04_9PEZI|nr:hypothetical protein F4821DRAFT_229955 [Hypoxylon rubiginosum]
MSRKQPSAMTPSKKQQWMTGPTFSIDDVIDPALSSDSSAATSTAKRKRASKPKVRTGCITWIRRVKCDETKPACTRCTSTGRKCDGYDGQAPPRRKKLLPLPADANSIAAGTEPRYLAKRHELARHSFATACRGNSALRVLRPLAADIEGTEQERQVFHQFRRHAEAGLAMYAASLGPGFWQRLVPQLGHSDAAVRHALIALGASYQSAQLQVQQEQGQGQGQGPHMDMNDRTATPAGTYSSRGSSPDEKQQQQQQRYASIPTSQPDDSSRYQRIEQLELFAIQQYNLSIYHLQRHVQPESPPESVEITLVCCLVFVCVETSRGNEAGALSHVANGLQIIKTMPSELTRTSGNSSSSSTPATIRMSRSDWRQLIDFFLALEPNVVAYESLTTSRCPSVDMWTPPSTDYFGEMPTYWEADIETWS